MTSRLIDQNTGRWQPWALSVLVATIGVSWQYLSLRLVEGLVTNYPSVPDVLMDRLPRVDFGLFGEMAFFSIVLLFVVPHFRWHWRDTPRVLTCLGVFYFVRGWYMLLFPIGAPFGAVDPALRLNIWGYASHAYFPGGHIGVLTTLAFWHPVRRLRPVMWIGVALFGVGTLLAKNHYTMDSVTGVIIAYAVSTWVNHRWRSSTDGI